MKASELRIGNLVDYFDRTTRIDIYHLKNLIEKDADYQPIPLTEEWLLRFGFKKEYNNDEIEKCNCFYLNNCDDSYYLNIDDDYDDWYLGVTGYGYLKSIEFIHQLQNLYFALTGTELTLNK